MPLRGKKVFVIERSAFILAQIRNSLEKAGVEVRSGENPSKSLLEILHWHPDAVISSVDIGDITGFDLCLILKMMPEHARIPFIIISSAESADIQAQMASVGADQYIPKDRNIAVNTYNAIRNALDISDADLLGAQEKEHKHSSDHILVVDDSAVMRRIVTNMLSDLGISNVGHASHGKEALERLNEREYGMVLTDWNMPFMNGLELARAIRERPSIQNLPIVMITTEGAQDEREQAEAVGVNDLVPKPFTKEHFREVLQKFL